MPAYTAKTPESEKDWLKENNIQEYTNIGAITEEVDKSKQLFKKFNWPTIDVTRKSVEETAASILKIFEINKKK